MSLPIQISLRFAFRLTGFVLVILVISGHSLWAQIHLAQKHPATDEWLAQIRTRYREDPLSDEILLRRLQFSRMAKFMEFGPKEVEIERFFQTALMLGGRFFDGLTDIPTAQHRQWRLLMSDVIIRGEVSVIQDKNEFCVYGSEVIIDIAKSFKGNVDGTVTFKRISGKRADGRRVIVTHQPAFKVGEQVIVLLTAVPFELHSQIVRYPCPEQTELFYLTNTGGAYYELMFTATVQNDSLRWFGRQMHVVDVEAEIEKELREGVED